MVLEKKDMMKKTFRFEQDLFVVETAWWWYISCLIRKKNIVKHRDNHDIRKKLNCLESLQKSTEISFLSFFFVVTALAHKWQNNISELLSIIGYITSTDCESPGKKTFSAIGLNYWSDLEMSDDIHLSVYLYPRVFFIRLYSQQLCWKMRLNEARKSNLRISVSGVSLSKFLSLYLFLPV